MDALTGVWLSSVVGALAFTAAGATLARSGLLDPLLSRGASEKKDAPPPSAPATAEAPAEASPPAPKVEAPSAPEAAEDEELAVDDRPTTVPGAAETPTPAVTMPPPPNALRLADEVDRETAREIEALRIDLVRAIERAEAATDRSRDAEAARAAAATQLEAARAELRDAEAGRKEAESRAAELADRLAAASEQASSLRHRVTTLEARARTGMTNPPPRRTMPPEAAPPRLYDSSLSLAAVKNPAALRPSVNPAAEDATIRALTSTVERLTSENKTLRMHALLAPPAKRIDGRASAPDIDLEPLRRVLERLAALRSITGAAFSDEVGAAVLGSGDLADAMCAFGAYIRDAGVRGERLLPIGSVEEVLIRDRDGLVFADHVVVRAPYELSLVVIAKDDEALRAAREIAREAASGSP